MKIRNLGNESGRNLVQSIISNDGLRKLTWLTVHFGTSRSSLIRAMINKLYKDVKVIIGEGDEQGAVAD